MNTLTPLDYGKIACDAFINRYLPDQLPPVGVLFYHQGVLLSGMQRIYLETGEKKYFGYIKAYVDSVIAEDGDLYGFNHEITTEETAPLAQAALTMLDHKMPSILFYNLYDETKDEKYLKAIRLIGESMHYWPVNQYGGYWHMMTQHNQMWMDGAYMAGPLSVMYADRFGDEILRERAINQIFIMNEHMRDEKTGLYYHGWDPTREAAWADKETGLSGQLWGRAVGWYAVAILDILDYIPENHPAVERLKAIEADLLKCLKKFQDEDCGMWYEVLDKPGAEGNWVESSCTNLFIYSYAKAIRMGIIDYNSYKDVLERAYRGSIASTYFDDNGEFVIDKVCIGTNIDSGTYEHYIRRMQIKNDLHGGGAFILMCSEMEKYNKYIGDMMSATK